MAQKTLTICNKLGLHARAAAKFVETANRFSSEVNLIKDGRSVNGKSIMSVMMLAATMGTEVTIEANGKDAEQALDAIATLINNKFDEGE
ncbi:MAG: HPr family phosphocarrier protein [Pontibacterium sp.]